MAIFKIDGNAMLHTVVDKHIKTKTPTDNSRPFFFVGDIPMIKNSAKVFYSNLLKTYLKDTLRKFQSCVDLVVFVTDAKHTWRKQFFIDQNQLFESRSDFHLLNNLGYKGQRDKTSDDAIQIKLMIDYLIEHTLPEIERSVSGFFHLTVNNAEGDDVLTLLQEYYGGTECFLWAKDSDLKQMLDAKTVMVKSPQASGKPSQLIHTKDFKLLKSIWYGSNGFIDIASSLVINNGYEDVEVDVVKDLFSKVLCGDLKSDNIPPIMCKKGDGKANISNFSPAKCANVVFDKVIGKYDYDNILKLLTSFNKEFVEDVALWSIEVFQKDKMGDVEFFKEVKKNIQVNIKLIRLSSVLMPKDVLESFCVNVKKVSESGSKFNFKEMSEL